MFQDDVRPRVCSCSVSALLFVLIATSYRVRLHVREYFLKILTGNCLWAAPILSEISQLPYQSTSLCHLSLSSDRSESYLMMPPVRSRPSSTNTNLRFPPSRFASVRKWHMFNRSSN